MKRLIELTLCLACAWVIGAGGAAFCADERDSIQLTVSGDFKGAVDTIIRDDKVFADAMRITKLLGGTAYWYAKSGKLICKLKGDKLQFSAKSDRAEVRGSRVALSAGAIADDDRLFVPLDFFTSAKFSGVIGLDAAYNEDAHSLDIDRRYQVGELDYFSYGNATRITLPLKSGISYDAQEKGAGHIEIIVPDAVAQAPEKAAIDDGLVKSANVLQNRGSVRVTVVLANPRNQWKISRESDALVMEVTAAPGGAEPAAQEQKPPAEKAPEAVRVSETAKGADKKVIIVDAGHGGKDPGGNKRRGTTEKSLNLMVAQEVAKLLDKDGSYEVLLTRTSDYFVPLDARSEMANNAQSDLFVSIHANAHRSRKENGFEIYFMSEKASDPWAAQVAEWENAVIGLEQAQDLDEAKLLLHSLARNEYMNEGAQLAGFIAKNLSGKIPMKNRGVKQAGFYVLRGTYAPAVLVEMGFMTNARDADNLNSKSVRAKIAKGIYDGIKEYAKFKGWEK